MDLNIDRNNGVPLYRQIVDQVATLIKCGVLKNGDQLPTERALARRYRLSLGTVKTAYSALALRCLTESIQGKGTFVNNSGLSGGPSRHLKQAAKIISAYLDRMSDLSLTLEEAEELMLSTLKARYDKPRTVRLAVLNCCREFLDSAVKRIAVFPGTSVSGFLVSELETIRDQLLDDFDLIITSPSHADVLKTAIPVLESKIVRISYSFDDASLARLATVKAGSVPAIFSPSPHGAEIIRNHLGALNPSWANAAILSTVKTLNLNKTLRDKGVLVVPAACAAFAAKSQTGDLACFRKLFGGLIALDFKIDEGSILYLGSEIARISMQKAALSQ